jgi:signal transduction histidine kinase
VRSMGEDPRGPAPDPGGGAAESIAVHLTRAYRLTLAGLLLVVSVLVAMLGYVLVLVHPTSVRWSSGELAVAAAHQAMIDQEAGLRGYLLTGKPAFLQPYRTGVAAVATEDGLASRYLGTDAEANSLLAAMRTAQQRWQSGWAVPTLASPPATQAANIASLNQDEALFDSYRSTEHSLILRVEVMRGAISRTGTMFLMVALGLTPVVGGVMTVVVLRARRRLREVLLEPVAEIVKATDRIANNDLATVAPLRGPEEFRRIAGGINQMARALSSYRDRLAHENERMLAEVQARAALDERNYLAQELHDSISQILFSMALQTRAAELTLRKDGLDPNGALGSHLLHLRELTNSALAEARALIFELRPGALQEEGLVAALRKQAARIAVGDGILAEVDARGERVVVDSVVEEQLYRIGQEALYNVVKHAKATRVRIRLTEAARLADDPGGRPTVDDLVLEISDDGVGFDPELLRPGHLGLQTMAQRAERIGSQLSVDSTPGRGTTVRVRVPGPVTAATQGGTGLRPAPGDLDAQADSDVPPGSVGAPGEDVGSARRGPARTMAASSAKRRLAWSRAERTEVP